MRRRDYEDPQKHLERHVQRSAEKYMNGLEQAGLKPNTILTRAMAERAVNEAKESYIRETIQTRDSNINVIMSEHHKRMNAIKREGANLRLKMCPPITLVFGVLAWYNFHLSDGFIVGIICAVIALAFFAMLVLGAIFDRPRR